MSVEEGEGVYAGATQKLFSWYIALLEALYSC